MVSGRTERREVGGREVSCQAAWEFEGRFKSCVCEWRCMCVCVRVCVCFLSVWAIEHGTEWWLAWRQLSWQQRMSSCSAAVPESYRPLCSIVPGLFLLFSYTVFFVPRHLLAHLSPSPSYLFLLSPLPLCLSCYILPYFPEFSSS